MYIIYINTRRKLCSYTNGYKHIYCNKYENFEFRFKSELFGIALKKMNSMDFKDIPTYEFSTFTYMSFLKREYL